MTRYALLIVLFSILGCTQSKPLQPGQLGGVPVETAPAAEAAPVAIEKTKKAEAGVSGKGNYSDAPAVMLPFTVPISQYFLTRDRTVFEMQIPKTMQLFEATEGRKPNSNEEFMTEIIVKGQIKLPELNNADDRYEYDPSDGELKVKTKVKK